MPQKMLCLSPHADDVELAMGGTISRFVGEGEECTIALLSASDYLTPNGDPVRGEVRRVEQQKAAGVLGCKWGFAGLFRENEALAKSRGQVISDLEKLIKNVSPDALFVPLPWFNQDHTVVWEATLAALRPGRYQPKAVYAYEMPGQDYGPPSPLGAGGATYVELDDDHMSLKIQAIKCHKSQGMDNDEKLIGPGGVSTLALMRGLEAGCHMAERFQLVRRINRL